MTRNPTIVWWFEQILNEMLPTICPKYLEENWYIRVAQPTISKMVNGIGSVDIESLRPSSAIGGHRSGSTGNSLLPDSIKPLPEAVWLWGLVTCWRQSHREYTGYLTFMWVWKLLMSYCSHVSQWPMSLMEFNPLQWRHKWHDSVSNHQTHDCLLNRLFRGRSKKTSKLRVTGHCAGNSPGTGEFPAQMASYAENASI